MSAESLATSLLKLPAVQSRLAQLEADSIVAQFASLVPVEALQNLKHDWHHLLTVQAFSHKLKTLRVRTPHYELLSIAF